RARRRCKLSVAPSPRRRGRPDALDIDGDSAVDKSPPERAPLDAPTPPSRSSERGLDWFAFFLADVQTGFGPFISVYLTAQAWTQVDIGLVLTISGLVALVGQMPGGALVDMARSERHLAGWSLVVISTTALMLAAWPIFPVVLSAEVLHAAASCVLGPARAPIR